MMASHLRPPQIFFFMIDCFDEIFALPCEETHSLVLDQRHSMLSKSLPLATDIHLFSFLYSQTVLIKIVWPQAAHLSIQF